MDIFCVCRTCLNESDAELVSIYSDIFPNDNESTSSSDSQDNNTYRIQIFSILDELTGEKYVCILFCIQNNAVFLDLFFFSISENQRVSLSR